MTHFATFNDFTVYFLTIKKCIIHSCKPCVVRSVHKPMKTCSATSQNLSKTRRKKKQFDQFNTNDNPLTRG